VQRKRSPYNSERTHEGKYESPVPYHLKDMTNVKVLN
jgi:hypothetical protein